jgi:hypothetical protein
MRIMTVGARHEAFVDAMLERHGKLATDIGVACVAKVDLALGQQEFRLRRLVDGVAIGAYHVVQRVGGAANVGAAQGFSVTAQAVIENLFGLQLGKGDYASFSPMRFDVRLAGTVAALASGVVRRFFAGCDTLVMRVLVKVRPNVGMARAAHIAPDVTGGSGGRLLSVEQPSGE